MDQTRIRTPFKKRSMPATGGTVLAPPGTYLTGTLFIKSGVELHLSVIDPSL